MRELEGALKRVLAYASFHGQEITLALAKEALRDLLAVQNRQISIENIQKTVADYYKIRVIGHALARSARARSRGRGRSRWRSPRSSPRCRCRRSAATSAAATTRRSCTRAGRSPSCANRMPDINHDVNFLLQVLRS